MTCVPISAVYDLHGEFERRERPVEDMGRPALRRRAKKQHYGPESWRNPTRLAVNPTEVELSLPRS